MVNPLTCKPPPLLRVPGLDENPDVWWSHAHALARPFALCGTLVRITCPLIHRIPLAPPLPSPSTSTSTTLACKLTHSKQPCPWTTGAHTATVVRAVKHATPCPSMTTYMKPTSMLLQPVDPPSPIGGATFDGFA